MRQTNQQESVRAPQQGDVRGSIAIVTGGASGIGRGIASTLADAGVTTVLADLDGDAAQQAANEIKSRGGIAEAAACDVTEADQVAAVVDATWQRFGRIDILVNSAGLSLVKHIQTVTEQEWDRIIDVNLRSMFLCCKAVSARMMQRRAGKIVNISSVVGKFATAMQVPYCASKFGVIGFTQALAYELAPFDINVNAICPGIVRTPMWDRVLARMSADTAEDPDTIFARYVEEIPLKRPQTPEDIGHLALFLCSYWARNITGQAISVTGGHDALRFDPTQ